MLLGLVNDRDVNADITAEEFLRRLEAALGPIELDQTDWDTPLSEPIEPGIPAELWMAPILDSRNVDLAAAVHNSADEKVVITYGKAHEPGWLTELQKLEPRWQPV
jgi:hypothetical protein